MARVLFFLPNLSHYQDRAKLLMEVSNGLEHMTLLVGRRDLEMDTAPYPNLKLVEVGFRRRLRPLNTWRASKMAERLIVDESLDIVHDTFGTLLRLFRKKDRYPTVSFATSLYTLAGWSRRHVWNYLSPIQTLRLKKARLMQQWYETRICQAADNVVLQAPGLVERLLEGIDIPKERISVLNNNVDVDFWRPVEGAPNRVPDPRSWRLLYVGGIDHTKGVFVMIEAMRVLAKREAQWNLTIIGSWGEYDRSEAMRMITEYDLGDSIEFLPASNRETIREHHRQADLFLYQTVNDAFPRVVLEAIASGLPVVASHHPGIDVVDPMGEFISFTEFGDVSQIVSHVEKMRSDPAEWSRKSTIGAQRVVEGFSTEVIAKAYCDYYDSISKSRETAQNGAANQR